ncbi:MAG: molybdenum cofactor guanylyltransferase [Opitutales bacterium]
MNTPRGYLLNGIVLAGGQSLRMGHDKALLNYHGTAQWLWTAQILQKFCSDIFISKNTSQSWDTAPTAKAIIDTEEAAGPFHPWSKLYKIAPSAHWLLLTCDLPLVSPRALSKLLESPKNNSSPAEAMCFRATDSSFPDPQIALLTPSATQSAEQAYQEGLRSPRKFLQSVNTLMLDTEDPRWLHSCNTHQEYLKIKEQVHPANP